MTSSHPAPGFFGKVPARGDFLSRRVPPGLAETWEAWLQVLTTSARAAAGEAWPEAWLTAPLWHFALGDALAPPHGAAGVLIASADRVGRTYPFTVLGPCDPALAADPVASAQWGQAAEALALAALEDGFDPAALDAALVRLGPPPPVTGPGAAPAVLPLGWTAGGAGGAGGEAGQEDAELSAILDGPQTVRGDVDDLLGPAPGSSDADPVTPADRPGPEQSVWWCRGSDRVVPVRLRCDGLPALETAAAMVLGGDAVAPG